MGLNSIFLPMLFSCFSVLLFCQNNSDKWASPQKNFRHHLVFQYFRIDRKKTGNGTPVHLNKDFEYLNLFDFSRRFAPDEPSSFSSLEFCFKKNNFSENTGYGVAAGVYRNHIKGDLLLPGHIVHFGRGNSQVGLSASSYIWAQVFKKMDLSFSVQLGLGPQFTKLTAGANEVSSGGWGIKGWGISSNAGLWADSPVLFRRVVIGLGAIYNYTWSKYRSFNVKNKSSGNTSEYKNVYFMATSKRPKLTIVFKYFFYK